MIKDGITVAESTMVRTNTSCLTSHGGCWVGGAPLPSSMGVHVCSCPSPLPVSPLAVMAGMKHYIPEPVVLGYSITTSLHGDLGGSKWCSLDGHLVLVGVLA